MTKQQRTPAAGKQLYEEFRAWQTQLYQKVQHVEPDMLCLLLAELVRAAELLDAELAAQKQACSN